MRGAGQGGTSNAPVVLNRCSQMQGIPSVKQGGAVADACVPAATCTRDAWGRAIGGDLDSCDS